MNETMDEESKDLRLQQQREQKQINAKPQSEQKIHKNSQDDSETILQRKEHKILR